MQRTTVKINEMGQGLVEYALVLVLISVGTIVSMRVLGPAIGNVYSDIDLALSYLSTSETYTVASCEFRQHNDHYHWNCGTEGELDFEKGRYYCGDMAGVPPDLMEQIEINCIS